jgi:type IV secretory pathway VirB2 component (pilin)
MMAFLAAAAIASQRSLFDPPQSPIIGPAADWVKSALLGSVATVIAVLAIASIGFAMLSGRIDIRRGLVVLLGCFVLFGAPLIARGLMSAAESNASPVGQAPPPPPVFAKPQPNRAPPTNAYDPYAGASVQR